MVWDVTPTLIVCHCFRLLSYLLNDLVFSLMWNGAFCIQWISKCIWIYCLWLSFFPRNLLSYAIFSAVPTHFHWFSFLVFVHFMTSLFLHMNVRIDTSDSTNVVLLYWHHVTFVIDLVTSAIFILLRHLLRACGASFH